MIVVGLDVHKHSLTAVAVDELGRTLAEHAGPVDERVVAWARSLGGERLWALEDCRHVTRGLELTLLEQDERFVRVPPRLTAPQRRRGRTRGKSGRIAVPRAALQEPQLGGPRAGEGTLRELKLLVDHRDDLVDERRRCQQRLRWHLRAPRSHPLPQTTTRAYRLHHAQEQAAIDIGATLAHVSGWSPHRRRPSTRISRIG